MAVEGRGWVLAVSEFKSEVVGKASFRVCLLPLVVPMQRVANTNVVVLGGYTKILAPRFRCA